MDYEFYARYDESDRTLEIAWRHWFFLNTLVSALSFCLNLFIFRTAAPGVCL